MFKERPTPHQSRVSYYRVGSAASQLSPADVPKLPLTGASLLHLTGVTCALGTEPRAFVHDAMRRAQAERLTVSLIRTTGPVCGQLTRPRTNISGCFR